MAGESDIQANISCNLDEFTAPLSGAIQQMEQMTTVVHLQETSWTTLGVSVLSAVANITGPVLSLYASYRKMQAATLAFAAANAAATPPTLTLAAAVNFLLSPIVLTIAAVTLLAGTIYYLSGAADDASAKIKQTGNAARDARDDLSSLEDVKDSFLAGFVGTEGLDAFAELQAAGEELFAALDDLGDALLQPLRDAGFEIGSVAEMFTGFISKVRMATDVIKTLTTFTDKLAEAAKEGIAQWTLFGTMLVTGMDADAAGEMIANRQAERDAAIEAFQAQKAENFAVEELAKLMNAATEAAERKSEISRIGRVFSVEALDEETKALEANIAALKRSGEFSQDARKDIEDRAAAIANQRQGLLDGTIVDKAAEEAKRALARAEEEAARAARKAAEEEERRAQRFKDRVAGIGDQIDLLTGAATKADIAMREALRAGATPEEAEGIRQKMEELERLEAEKNKKSDGRRDTRTEFKAALAGTSEAASVLLRGVGGGKTMEQIANKQLAELQQIKLAVKDNRPQELQPLTLGT